jgi:hypothetical protein
VLLREGHRLIKVATAKDGKRNTVEACEIGVSEWVSEWVSE